MRKEKDFNFTRGNVKLKAYVGVNLAYIWRILGEMIKKWGRARFYLSCNYYCTLYFSVKILLAQLKSVNNTSACLNVNYGTAKQQPKM